jgi:NTE family protein
MAGVRRTSKKLAVVFSSGFFGFFAHAGFLAALRAQGISPCAYGGASSGAIVSAMAASGMSDAAVKDLLFELRKRDFWDPDPWPYRLKKALTLFEGYSGYLVGEGFARLLEKLPAKTFEDCPTPLAIVATNLTLRRENVFTKGDLRAAIRASGAVPMLFKPVEIDGSLYVDGGVTNKAPVEAVADLVKPARIVVHFISSQNLKQGSHAFLKERLTPWRIHRLAGNIARQEAYKRRVHLVRMRGIDVVEVETDAPAVSPGRLRTGRAAYARARDKAEEILSRLNL